MDISSKNRAKLKSMFPSVFIETINEKGEISETIDFDKLKAEFGIFNNLSEQPDEHYGLNWYGKKDCIKTVTEQPNSRLTPVRQESINFDDTENMFIEGDNLEVLKILQKNYYGKIKMIYIDPPYNTGKDFIYNDNYSETLKAYTARTTHPDNESISSITESSADGRFHTKWLNMMYPRIYLARNLLKQDGVIFISIDDNELANLRILCDEIFGKENFAGLLSVENNPKGRKNSKFISVTNDYCLIYAKDARSSRFIENIPKNFNDMKPDENGKYIHGSGKRVLVGENSYNKYVSNQNSDKHYSVYYNKKHGKIKIKQETSVDEADQRLIETGYIRYISVRNGKFIENTYTQTKFTELFNKGALEFKEKKIFEKNFNSKIRLKSMLINKEYDALINNKKKTFKIDLKTTSAGTALKKLLETDKPVFPASKNINFIKLLITLFEEKDFIVLDFFAGSCSTAHAVLELNTEDGGNRKFIMVELPEKTSVKSEAFRAGYKTISDIGKERIRRVIEDLSNKTSGKSEAFKAGVKVFKLT